MRLILIPTIRHESWYLPSKGIMEAASQEEHGLFLGVSISKEGGMEKLDIFV